VPEALAPLGALGTQYSKPSTKTSSSPERFSEFEPATAVPSAGSGPTDVAFDPTIEIPKFVLSDRDLPREAGGSEDYRGQTSQQDAWASWGRGDG